MAFFFSIPMNLAMAHLEIADAFDPHMNPAWCIARFYAETGQLELAEWLLSATLFV